MMRLGKDAIQRDGKICGTVVDRGDQGNRGGHNLGRAQNEVAVLRVPTNAPCIGSINHISTRASDIKNHFTNSICRLMHPTE